MKIKLTGLTDAGKDRENNEDAFFVCPDLDAVRSSFSGRDAATDPRSGALAIVADGMGGAKAGEIASSIAISSIRDTFARNELPCGGSDEAKCHFLKDSIVNAHAAIMERVESDPETIGMGTTVVALWLTGTKVHIAWCGDSRCYVFHPGRGLRALTKDHSFVQELLDRGEIGPEAVFGHPDSNLITRGLGDIDMEVSADTLAYPFAEGDIFLICSDGLCGYCCDKAIEDVMDRYSGNIKECRDELLKIALDAGGYDNITVVLLAVMNDSGDHPRVSFWNRLTRKHC